MRIFLIVACLVFFVNSGCVRDCAETEKEILSYDPSFSEILDIKKAAIKELNDTKVEFLAKEDQIIREVGLLKTRRRELKRAFSEKSGRIHQRLDPEKRELQRLMVDIEREVKHKQIFVKDINRDIEEINVLIDKKESLALTQEEIRTWNDRLSTLMKNKEAAVTEINRNIEEIRVTKLKLKVMEIR